MSRVAITGARGVLGSALVTALSAYELRLIDRRDGVELEDRQALRGMLAGCDAVAHLAALHPLVAPLAADATTYERANVRPFRALLEIAAECGVRRIVLASSTSVWRDASEEGRARFVDEDTPADDTSPYSASKLACETLLSASLFEAVILRLARFAREGDPEDETRKLYRAVDARDAALAVALALEARAPALFAISAPTPFLDDDAELLMRDPAGAIKRRIGITPEWVPPRIATVVRATRAERVLGWRARYPSQLLRA